LLGGRAPFSGDPKELLKAHAYEEPPPARPVNRVPEGVVGFVTLCMKKRPWDRFEFAAEARRAWAAFQPAEDVDPRLYRLPVVAGPTQANAAPSLTDVTTPKLDDATRRKSVPAPGDKAHGLLSIRPTPMVGRTSVRDHLLAACADMVANRGPAHRLTLLIGPAGVGKSRIAEWLTSVVHEDGRMVPLTVRYRRIRGSSDGMLGAITQHFNFERADRTTIERSLMARWSVSSQDTKMRTWVAATAEWLRPHDPGSDTVGPSGLRVTLDTLEARRRVIRFVLRRIAGGRPLLFFLDDLHNAAQTTLEGLLRIHATESDQRILMAATVRAEDVQLGTLTAERISRLQEQMGGEVIHIDPLDRDTTAQLLRAAIPLEESAVVEATRRSRGSPLFALQQLHAWAHAGDFQFENGVYRVPSEVLAVRPKTTADLWESRLATLAPQHQLAGYAVSTLGLDIRRTVLKAMVRELGLNADEVIVSLQNAEIILPRGPGRYNWAHALLQEHLFRKLSERPDSRRVFVAAAEALKAHPLANTRRVVRQRCINLLYASEPESAAGVFFHFLEQGWHGSRQPVESLTDLDLFRDRLRGTPQGIALRWRAEALRQLGRTEEATRYATQALQLLGNAEDPIALAHCQRILGGLKCEQGDFESGTSLLQAALQAFQLQKNAPGMAQCEYALGQVELSLGRHEHARGFARLGDAHFAGANDPLGRGHCLLLLGAVERADGAIERARQLTIEARTEFERSGDQLGQAETTLALALCEHRLSNFFSADRGAAEALSLFESLKIARGRAACERLLAMVAIDTDNVERGGEHAERAEQLYSELRDPFGVVECRLLRAQASLVRRDFAEARRAIMQAREIGLREPEPRQHYLLTRAWFQLENGDSDSAQEALNAAPTVFAKAWQVGGHTLHLLTRLTRLAWPVPETINDIQEWRRVIQERAKSDIQK
jgi:tetratricopeptide (TPR) repeat protein